MRALLRLLIAFAASLVPAHADNAPWYVDLARDGDGRTWAKLASGSDLFGHLVDGKYVSLPKQALDHYSFKRFLPLRDGSMGCVWNGFESGGCFSRHRGDAPPIVFPFAAQIGEPILQELSDGSILITEHSLIQKKEVYVVLLSPEGKANVLTIPNDWFQHPPEKVPDWRWFAPICATEDGGHRLWLWSYPLSPGTSEWQLPAFVTIKDGKLEKQAVPGVEPTDRITGMISFDETHLWYAKLGAGIFSLDTTTLQSTPVSQPLPERNGSDNVQYIQQLFREGGDVFALTCPRPWNPYPQLKKDDIEDFFRPPVQYATYDDLAPRGRLLRYRDAKWEEILTGVDSATEFRDYDRPHLMTPAGLLIGSSASGPWLALRPEGKPPIQLDWKSGFSLPSTKKFFLTGKNKIRVLTTSGDTAGCPIEPSRDPSKVTLEESWLPYAPVSDALGNLWGFRTRSTLGKWDGRAWSDLAVPPAATTRYEEGFFWGDDRNQGWLMNQVSGTAAICDFATGQWKTYPSWETAMVAQLPRAASNPETVQHYGPPLFSDAGGIAYLRWGESLNFYDGAKWTKWNLHEIAGETVTVDGYPFFDERRRLCIALSGAVHVWSTAEARWSSRAPQPRDRLRSRFLVTDPPPPALPEGCLIKDAYSAVRDALGTSWILTKTGVLYKSVPGKTVRAVPETEPTPFMEKQQLERVFIDPLGGALIDPYGWDDPSRLFRLPAKLPLPESSAKLVDNQADTVRVQLAAGAEPEIWYGWQLDNGPWRPVQKERELVLTDLSAGAHRLQVRAYNAELGGDRTPALLEWKSAGGSPKAGRPEPAPLAAVPLKRSAIIADPAMLQARVGELAHPTREKRVAAAAFLRAQGAAALPLLREAEKAGPVEAQWWVNKVIAEIESDLKGAETRP